jgi:hypothetical protein
MLLEEAAMLGDRELGEAVGVRGRIHAVSEKMSEGSVV